MPAAIPFVVQAVVTTVVATGISYAANALFGGNQKPSQPSFGSADGGSPRYGFGALQNTISSDIALGLIYGEIKYAGNYLVQEPPEGGEEVVRALGLCTGEIDRIYDVRFNDLMVSTEGQYVGVDLGAGNAAAIQEVKIYQGGSGFNAYALQASHDKVDWRDITTGTLTSTAEWKTISFSNAVEYRYWRILSTGAGHSASSISIGEMELRTTGGGANLASGMDAFFSFEDEASPASNITDGNTGTAWTATKQIHANNSYTAYLGTTTQAIDSRLTGLIEYAWRGTAHLAMTIHADDKLRGDTTATCIVRGKKVKRWNGSIFTGLSWSNNPAECLRDFMTDTYNGVGISEAEIDDESFGSAAEHCDELITNNNGDLERRYIFNYAIDSRRPAIDIINTILQSFGAFLVQSQGKYILKVRQADAAVMSFDDGVNGANDNILSGSFGYSEISKDDDPNRIRFQYVDPEQNWTRVFAQAEDKIDQDYRATLEGGNGVVTQEIASMAVTRFTQASRLALMTLKEKKFTPVTVVFKTNIKALPLDAGDVVNLSHALPNWTNKPFRIIQIRQMADDTMEIQAIEYNASIYNDEFGSAVQNYNYGTPGNPLAAPAAPSAVSIAEDGDIHSSGDWVGWIDVTITPPANTQYIDRYQIEYRKGGAGNWISAGTTTGTVFRIIPIVAPETYEVRVKSVSINDRLSDPTYAAENPLSTLGKLAPPSDVTGFAVNFAQDHLHFQWNVIPDVDAYGYEIREGDAWETAVVIATEINGNTFDLFTITTGTKNYMIKAIDTSGIYSVNPTSDSIVITEIPNQNIIVTLEDLFAGTLSGEAELVWTKDYSPDYYREAIAVKTVADWTDGGTYPLTPGPYSTDPAIYTAPVIDLGQSFTSTVALDVSVANVSGATLLIEIAYSDADPDPSTFENYTTGEYTGRYFKFRFTLTSDGTNYARIFKIDYAFDVPDKEQAGLNIAVVAAGTVVPLNGFYALKALVVNAVGSPYKEHITAQDASGFTVRLKDLEDGTYKDGSINYYAKGY